MFIVLLSFYPAQCIYDPAVRCLPLITKLSVGIMSVIIAMW
uniref:Uncharacterized protein n=1 Tax=Arundo donax TaxID=35708 RepID=A0A0A9M7R4_ARUDO